jgi:hypothetical protein
VTENGSGNDGWSQADKRLFLITFLGGLAANVGVVLIIAAAIATDRSLRSGEPRWVPLVTLVSIGLSAFAGGMGLAHINPNLKGGWVWLIFAGGYVLLCLLGYAAGIAH